MPITSGELKSGDSIFGLPPPHVINTPRTPPYKLTQPQNYDSHEMA